MTVKGKELEERTLSKGRKSKKGHSQREGKVEEMSVKGKEVEERTESKGR